MCFRIPGSSRAEAGDPSILFAMLVYGIVAFALGCLIGWLTGRILELRAGVTGRGTPQPLG